MIIPLRFTLVEHFFIGSDKYMTDFKNIGIIEQECGWSMLISCKNQREGGSFKEVKMPRSIFNFKSPLGGFSEEYGSHNSFMVLRAHMEVKILCARMS